MKQYRFFFLLLTSLLCLSPICKVNGTSLYPLCSTNGNNGSKIIVHLYVVASIDITTKGNSMPKSPVAPRAIEINSSSIFLNGKFDDMSIVILYNDNVIYSQFVPQGTENIDLPFEFTAGNYEIIIDECQTRYVGNLYI